MTQIVFYESAEAAEASLTARIVKHLESAASATAGPVAFMISGGATPRRVLPRVLAADLPWERILVYASDERCVPVDHPDSTEGMARAAFAEAGRPLCYLAPFGFDADARTALWAAIEAAPAPAVAFLGLGADGHVASLFAERADLAHPAQALVFVPETAPHLHARISLTLPALLRAQALEIAVVGAAKRAAFDSSATGSPIARLREAAGDRLTAHVAA